ncbi:ParA family partition ATPase [Roseinatronobacter bogoriensis]|uniref:ParA family protein n=1 Tax=Roseinatronobacter bogoriensis subsp. barguzinensis TaxID=441209 RepID=A0A2K8K8I6_9RHOB|nr:MULTISPECIES: ParA family partition ATPase [Rhodobaca]ATX65761.1 ParA family protein [Rhodobaca barguzinensis]MBB4208286.1 chromosome partitioning protein [Rhodobaca bogoriensis DSM 18756]TDW38927.1 chromosome partitioning protein [Rhodobaca barguzinensis]TDY68890.1 chromosome partitioning protein [Rhodobaca bogoriensis DSM 18756]
MAKGKVITIAQQKGGSGKTTLAVNLGVMLARAGYNVAFLDTDPQGSLGRWFMTRNEADRTENMEFSTASAWGVGYEVGKLRDMADFVIIDTPPKADSDLRPALRVADLVLVPVASSHVDLWATDGVLDLTRREGREVLVVLNRARAGTRLGTEVMEAAQALSAALAKTQIANRVAYAETLGLGLGGIEGARSPAMRAELEALASEVSALLQDD